MNSLFNEVYMVRGFVASHAYSQGVTEALQMMREHSGGVTIRFCAQKSKVWTYTSAQEKTANDLELPTSQTALSKFSRGEKSARGGLMAPRRHEGPRFETDLALTLTIMGIRK